MGSYHIATQTLWFYDGHSHEVMRLSYFNSCADKVAQLMVEELNFLENRSSPRRIEHAGEPGTFYLSRCGQKTEDLTFYKYSTGRHIKIFRVIKVDAKLADRALQILLDKLKFQPGKAAPQKLRMNPQPIPPGREAKNEPVKKKKRSKRKYPQLSLFDCLEEGGGQRG